jgi:hypothetical protein
MRWAVAESWLTRRVHVLAVTLVQLADSPGGKFGPLCWSVTGQAKAAPERLVSDRLRDEWATSVASADAGRPDEDIRGVGLS